MKFLTYLAFRLVGLFFYLIPFEVLYFFSDILSYFLRETLKYRRSLIIQNIQSSFPQLSAEEQLEILKASYKNLSDIILEGIKGTFMSKDEIMNRHKFINPELLDNAFKDGKSVILITGHYNNWEWGALSAPLYFKHRVIGIYKKINNPFIDKYFVKTRSKTGIILSEIRQTAESFREYSNAEPPALFLMAADQSPSNIEKSYWVNFLNQPTACLHGPEKYSTAYKLPTVYCSITRKERGYYELKLSWLSPQSPDFEEGALTQAFMTKLEDEIKVSPGNWLWSHNRWKHKR